MKLDKIFVPHMKDKLGKLVTDSSPEEWKKKKRWMLRILWSSVDEMCMRQEVLP